MPINKLGQHFLNEPVQYFTNFWYRSKSKVNVSLLGVGYTINYSETYYMLYFPSAVIEDIFIYPATTIVKVINTGTSKENLIGAVLSNKDELMFIKPLRSKIYHNNCLVQFLLKLK